MASTQSADDSEPFAAIQVARLHHAPQLLNGFTVKGGGAAHGFEAIELGGIVAARDHHGAIGFEMKDGIVEHRRGDHAQIGNMAAAGFEAADQRIPQARRAETRIAAQVILRPEWRCR